MERLLMPLRVYLNRKVVLTGTGRSVYRQNPPLGTYVLRCFGKGRGGSAGDE